MGVGVAAKCNEKLCQLQVAVGTGKHEWGPPVLRPCRQHGTEREQKEGNPSVALHTDLVEGRESSLGEEGEKYSC